MEARARVIAWIGAVPARDVRRVLASLAAALLVLALAALVGRALDGAYLNRALPGVSVGGVAVGSLDTVALRARLAAALAARQPAAIAVRSDDRSWLASDTALGLEPDLDATIRTAVTYGKEGAAPARLGAWLSALSGGARLPLTLRPTAALGPWIESVAREAERLVGEGSLVVEAGGVRAVPPVAGRYVDRVALAAALRSAFAPGDRVIALPVRDVLPELDPATFPASVVAARAALQPLRLAVAGATLDVDPAILAPVVAVRREALAPDPDARGTDAFVPATRLRFAVGVDEASLRDAVAALAPRLDRPARDASFRLEPNGVPAVVPGASGALVDRTALAAALRAAVGDPAAPRVVSLATSAVAPVFTTEEAERDAPFLTRVGFAERYHARDAGSPLAALDLLLPPGAALAGDALPARTADVLFAAALAAGYAADGAVPGWRNDTAHAVYARAAATATSTAWELWSIPTGRDVRFGPPTAAGTVVRRVSGPDGALLSSLSVPARYGPLLEPEAPPAGIPVTGVGADR